MPLLAKLGLTLLFKSPINTMRIGYLNAISPRPLLCTSCETVST